MNKIDNIDFNLSTVGDVSRITTDSSPISPQQTTTGQSIDASVPEEIKQKAEVTDKITGKITIDNDKIRQFMADLQKMQKAEEHVIAHESAHISAGGQYAGTASYGFSQGPDGKNYITSGEVPIDISEEKTPADTKTKMAIVQKAALAPSDPSPADLAIAAQAAIIAANSATEETKIQKPKTKTDIDIKI